MSKKNTARKFDPSTLPEEFQAKESFADLLEQSFKTEKREGNVVKGTVVAVEKDDVVIDIGLKTEGRVPLREFGHLGETAKLKVGDEVEVYLERIENRNGEAMLSREKALREESWVKFEESHNAQQNVDGVIVGRVKGGFTVDLGGAIAFLPGSQVDVRPVKDITPLMNISQPFQILKMDRKRGNIVVSRRAILEESRSEARSEMLSQIEEGQTLEGTVKNLTDYGAFIDLGSVDGLLHVTDISWKRVNHPSEVLSIGQKVKVKIIKHSKDTGRISLGMKQLESSPWDGIEQRFPVGTRLKGRVTNIADYGAFVELEPGIEGLVHVSELSWTKKNAHPNKVVTIGQEVEVVVLDIDITKHRISLGMKQANSNPWAQFAAENPAGTLLEGEIKNIAEFGLFVGLNAEMDGLVHISDLSWAETPEEAVKKYKKGDTIKVVVLSVDPEKERISLGLKQLDSDPFDQATGSVNKGDVATFKVVAVREDGIEVEVSNGLTSFIKRADLSSDRSDQRPERFAVGDRVDAKVTNVDKITRKISLSIKAYEQDEHKRAIAEFGSADSGASLGDILGVALDKSKQKKTTKAKKASE
jgi:small subunit ribosomal protein S1